MKLVSESGEGRRVLIWGLPACDCGQGPYPRGTRFQAWKVGTLAFTDWLQDYRGDVWGGSTLVLSSAPSRPRLPTRGALLLPHCSAAEAVNSLEYSPILTGSSTGRTLAAAVRNELSTSGQGTQASAALPSLPTPALSCPLLPCPCEGSPSSSRQWQGGLPDALKHHPHPSANLTGPAWGWWR